jgi:hypothetical protein
VKSLACFIREGGASESWRWDFEAKLLKAA